MSDDFNTRFYAAPTALAKIQLCISENRYKVVTRKDKPNLNGAEYILPILSLPPNHPCSVKPKTSNKEDGSRFVIDFNYQVILMGAEVTVYFKGFFGKDNTLKLVIQSLRKERES